MIWGKQSLIQYIIARLPHWFFETSAVIIIVALLISLWWITLGAKRFSAAMGRENKLIKLQEDVVKLKSQNLEYVGIYSQVTIAIINSQSFLESFHDLRMLSDPHELRQRSANLIQRIIESLASDIKSMPGDKHRCGVWIQDGDEELLLVFGSTGFAESYIGFRRLKLNWSVAGKSFRKSTTVNIDDVIKNDDWEKNINSASKYTSLICIPLGFWGILTIDGHNPMNESTVNIGSLYASLLVGALAEFDKASALIYEENYSAEASSSVE